MGGAPLPVISRAPSVEHACRGARRCAAALAGSRRTPRTVESGPRVIGRGAILRAGFCHAPQSVTIAASVSPVRTVFLLRLSVGRYPRAAERPLEDVIDTCNLEGAAARPCRNRRRVDARECAAAAAAQGTARQGGRTSC